MAFWALLGLIPVALLAGWLTARQMLSTRHKAALDEAQRTIAALRSELQERSANLEEATRELDSFVYGVSHDVRAPLRAIEGFARILEEDYGETLDDEACRHLRVIRDSAAKLERLIDGLVRLSRVSRHTLCKSEVDMSALARQAVREVSDAYAGLQPELVIGELPKAHGDPVLLSQVWQQLIDNAFKFSAKASWPRIEIGARADEENGSLYYIKDNGAGFEMRYASRLFEVFQRLHAEREFPGIGVGLAIVHRIVTRHGGRTWAEGEADKGACFYFALPKRTCVSAREHHGAPDNAGAYCRGRPDRS